MTNSIQELKKMILNSDVKVSDILRHALIVASEHDNDSIPWIKQETNGYEPEDKCPKYRRVHGIPRAKDKRTNQMIPLMVEDNKLEEALSRTYVANSILALENLIEGPQGSLQLPYPRHIQDDLLNFTKTRNTSFSLEIHPPTLIGVLGGIRTELLNWVIDLSKKEEHSSDTTSSDIIFPPTLISRLPNDIKLLADEFNFNFSHDKAYACMLILRRILPLSIVKKFQENGQEETIKKGHDYLDTMPLLEKAENLITKRRYKEIISYKKFLDASQHSYTFSPEISDVLQVATTLRLILDDFFPDKNTK